MKLSDFKINSLVAFKERPDVLLGHVSSYYFCKHSNNYYLIISSVDRHSDAVGELDKPLPIKVKPELLTLFEC